MRPTHPASNAFASVRNGSVALLLLACSLCSNAAAKDTRTAAVETAHDVHTVSLNTLQGTVRVYLPDDMAAGDTISGTVEVSPSGKTDSERAANSAVLSGTVIDIGGERTTAGAKTLKIRVPPSAVKLLPVVFSPAGRTTARTSTETAVPLASAPAVAAQVERITATPGGFNWPPVLQQSSPATVSGFFDGDFADTRLTVGGNEAVPVAESPRQAVFKLPEGATGITPVQLQEGDTTVDGSARSVQVRLSAPRTNLLKGESVEVTVQVDGLKGLNHPVPLELRTTGTVQMEGGNLQRLNISPRDPDPNGVFRSVRTLTGTAAGGFDVYADIVWAQPTYHWLEGRTVHVEGEPGGQAGRWRVPITLQGDKAKRGIYLGGDKPPNLHYCNWIEIKDAEERDGVDFVNDYVRTTDPAQPPKSEPKPGTSTTEGAKPPVPPAPGESSEETTEPPPCEEGAVRVLSSEEKKFTLLDGKQELFLHVETDKDRAAVAAGEFADYLKKIAELGGKVGEHLPEGTGAGGATVDILLKYLEQGGDIIGKVLEGKLKLAGASKFTATMDAGLRDVVAICTTMETCVRGVWVTSKKFSQTETKRREQFTKKAVKGDDEWEKISDSTGHIDPAKAAKWANDFFTEQANILKGNGDDLQKFKDACK